MPTGRSAGLALQSSFASALNELLYVTAGVALVGAVFATALIRRKDFHRPDTAAAPAGAGGHGGAGDGLIIS